MSPHKRSRALDDGRWRMAALRPPRKAVAAQGAHVTAFVRRGSIAMKTALFRRSAALTGHRTLRWKQRSRTTDLRARCAVACVRPAHAEARRRGARERRRRRSAARSRSSVGARHAVPQHRHTDTDDHRLSRHQSERGMPCPNTDTPTPTIIAYRGISMLVSSVGAACAVLVRGDCGAHQRRAAPPWQHRKR